MAPFNCDAGMASSEFGEDLPANPGSASEPRAGG